MDTMTINKTSTMKMDVHQCLRLIPRDSFEVLYENDGDKSNYDI